MVYTKLKVKDRLVSGNKCPRCQLNLDTPHYSEGKKITCPYCNSVAIRIQVHYKDKFINESYHCTNEMCSIRITTRRDRNDRPL